jgi:DNA-binding CsgD family transcriptional regulator
MPSPSAPSDDLERGRASYDRRDWAEAFDAFVHAEGRAPLGRDDLERLVWSAALTGHNEAFLGALEQLHKACVEARERAPAARAAFWIGFHLSSLGASSRATGWLARAKRLVEDEGEPCAERGYLLLPTVYRHLGAADNVAAHAVASEAAEIGEGCHDGDLVALARNLQGRALLRQGRIEPGLALLDEVMLAVTSGELSPLVTGIVYCNVIVTCQQIYALDRAREWTAALAHWCQQQPQLVTFTGHCLVHRAEIMQLGGDWPEAIEEVRQICERRRGDADPDVFGDACYQQAELLRLRGELVEAEKAYRLASQHGREPQPGLALLRVAQGQTESAVSAIRRVLSTTKAKWQRARLLPAFVEIMCAAGEVDEARGACRELEEIAQDFGTEIVGAMAAHALGALRLVEGDARGAIEPLQHAFGVWHKAGAPYIAARIRVLLGRAFLALGDRDGAELERDAARNVFEELGATPDLAALAASAEDSGRARVHGLSRREIEVLRLLASGKTNKVIARSLYVSERTVDRHVSNIFKKIGVPSRAAATAFAYENELI